MCTLTFYSKPTEKGAFILTFSRDEAPNRSTIDVVKDEKRGLIYPKDVLHGGSWLAISTRSGRFTCLQNGAFECHKRQLPYRKSRGLVLLESFDYQHFIDFCEQYNFDNIEPFTMVTLERNLFMEFRWDGANRHIRQLPLSTPQIWSSCTLYDPSVQSRRKAWFYEFLRKKTDTMSAIDLLKFHKTPNLIDPENGILMHRSSGLKTVSIAQLTISNQLQTIKFQYNELGNKDIYNHDISFGKALANA